MESGDFSLFGQIGSENEICMQRIGALVENPGIYPNMTAYENMKMKSIAMGVRDKKEAAGFQHPFRAEYFPLR